MLNEFIIFEEEDPF